MKLHRKALKRIGFLILAVGIGFVLLTGIGRDQGELPPAEALSSNQVVASAGLPVRLKIPKIGVDALVEQMGLTTEGAMEAPSGAKNVGWYKLGVYPGNEGSAVIDGHYGTWKNGDTSVFDDINKLVAGDSIIVEDEKGVLVTFIVRELQTLGKDDDATAVFASTDDKAHLNLITCQGDWIDDESTRADRLVVFADKQTE